MNFIKKIKAVLFDMDGTILDTERIHKNCWEQAMSEMKIDFAPDTFNDLVGLNDKSIFEYFQKRYAFTEAMYKEMSALARKLSEEYGAEKGFPVKKGFFELSDYIIKNGIKTAVVTSSFRSKAICNLKIAGIDIPFDIIIGGDSVSCGKPSAEPYLKAAKELGFTPSDCIAVEDSANGIKSVHNAGIKCVYIKDVSNVPPEVTALAEYKAESLDEIIEIIEKI